MLSHVRIGSALLFLGDAVVLMVSLLLTLSIRNVSLPDVDSFILHLVVFSPLFAVWLILFYVSGLYDKKTVLMRRGLARVLIRTQILNIIIAALFFFALPSLPLAPRTNLLIYLMVSLVLLCVWRIWCARYVLPSRRPVKAILIGAGEDIEALYTELKREERYGIDVLATCPPSEPLPASVAAHMGDEGIAILDIGALESADRSPLYHEVVTSGRYELVRFAEVYEEVFDRVPLSIIDERWFLHYASRPASHVYLALKRFIDIVGGIAMAGVTAFVTPLVWVLMRLEGKGPLFITQERIGQHGRIVKAYKFRTMTQNDAASGQWVPEGTNKVTRLGAVLRLTSLDEFPQCIQILQGHVSLIGPRNDIRGLGERLSEALPYYRMRYLVKPGITGWAQVNQQYEQGNISPQSIAETRTRLAYDFYYLKHRSLILDMMIALKTMKRMLFRLSSV